MVSKRTEDLIRKELAHFFGPMSIPGIPAKRIFERGDGALLWDTEGKEYIDMSSGGGQAVHLGFSRKELADAAYEQMKKMSWPSTLPAIEYAAELAEVLPHSLNHVFFVCSGSEACEVAIRMAKRYWNIHGQAGKYKVLCISEAYHGLTALTMTLLGCSEGRNGYGPEVCGGIRMPNYHCHRCAFGLKYPSCNMACAHYVNKVIEMEGEHSIACMIAEPIQGFGGQIWPPDEYWPIVRKILTDHNILLIADCVQNGFCRTGKFWGVNNWNIVPDLLTMGKGINSIHLPLGAIGMSDKVFEAFTGKQFWGGGTASGHPVCIATARAALKIYIEEKLAERAAKLGEHIHDRLVKDFLPLPCVDDVMGMGCYHSFEIALGKTTGHKVGLEEEQKVRDYINNRCLEKGILSSQYDGYPRRQPIVPPLIIGEDELDRGLDVMLSVMKEVKPV